MMDEIRDNYLYKQLTELWFIILNTIISWNVSERERIYYHFTHYLLINVQLRRGFANDSGVERKSAGVKAQSRDRESASLYHERELQIHTR